MIGGMTSNASVGQHPIVNRAQQGLQAAAQAWQPTAAELEYAKQRDAQSMRQTALHMAIDFCARVGHSDPIDQAVRFEAYLLHGKA